MKRRPEPHRSVTDRQLWHSLEPPAFQIQEQIARPLAKQIRQRVGRKSFWCAKRDNCILRHVAYHFLCENCGV